MLPCLSSLLQFEERIEVLAEIDLPVVDENPVPCHQVDVLPLHLQVVDRLQAGRVVTEVTRAVPASVASFSPSRSASARTNCWRSSLQNGWLPVQPMGSTSPVR